MAGRTDEWVVSIGKGRLQISNGCGKKDANNQKVRKKAEMEGVAGGQSEGRVNAVPRKHGKAAFQRSLHRDNARRLLPKSQVSYSTASTTTDPIRSQI